MGEVTLMAPRHKLVILMQQIWWFFKCLMKTGRSQKRLFNSVLTSDQYLQPLKKKKENYFLFQMLKLSYDVVKE